MKISGELKAENGAVNCYRPPIRIGPMACSKERIKRSTQTIFRALDDFVKLFCCSLAIHRKRVHILKMDFIEENAG